MHRVSPIPTHPGVCHPQQQSRSVGVQCVSGRRVLSILCALMQPKNAQHHCIIAKEMPKDRGVGLFDCVLTECQTRVKEPVNRQCGRNQKNKLQNLFFSCHSHDASNRQRGATQLFAQSNSTNSSQTFLDIFFSLVCALKFLFLLFCHGTLRRRRRRQHLGKRGVRFGRHGGLDPCLPLLPFVRRGNTPQGMAKGAKLCGVAVRSSMPTAKVIKNCTSSKAANISSFMYFFCANQDGSKNNKGA